MKKLLTAIAALALTAAGAFAQNLNISAGYINSSNTRNSSIYHGFSLGANAEVYFSEYLGATAGLHYSFLNNTKESSVGYGDYGASGKRSTSEHYVTIPLHVAGRYEIINGITLFAHLGPALNFGLASNTKYSGSVTGFGSSERKVNNYESGYYRRSDILLGGKLGVDLSGLKVFVGYYHGLLNRDKAESGASDPYHRSEFQIGLGWAF